MTGPAAAPSGTITRGSLVVVLLTVFLDMVAFGVVIPILPTYAETLHASDMEVGVLLAIYSAMQLVFSPIWGRLSDRAGRRPIILLSVAGSCLSQIGYTFAPTFWWLVAARGVAGICGANITAAQAYIADVTEGPKRAARMGLLGAALGMGFVCGPALGGLMPANDPTRPFLIAGCLSGLNFLLALLLLVEPRDAGQRSQARALSWGAIVETVASRRVLALILLFFLVTLGFANLESTFSIFLKRVFGYGRRETSLIFAFIGAIIVIVQGGLVRRLVPRFGEKALVVAGTGLMAVGFALQGASQTVALLMVAIGIVAAGNALNNPSLSALASRAAEGDRQGSVLGVYQAAGALARIMGPLMGTFMLRFSPSAPFYAGSVLLLLATAFAVTAVRQPER